MPDDPLSPTHFDGQRFFNPGAPQARGFLDVLKWKLTSRPQPWPHFVSDVQPSQPPASISGPELRVTLINHSTVLLQQRDTHILTDPVWSERASPFQWIGPRRHRAPGVLLEDLPRIDIVLLSHNHYDHLDLPTLRKLARRGDSKIVVALGLARFLESNGIGPAHELDWAQSLQLDVTTIHCVPAMHFSARTPLDRNRTLWCGFVVETHGRTIYFAADTAFGPHFAAIRDRFGSLHLALLPIGAYEPRWFMSPVHMAADEAARAHEILGARTSIAIHHGTFQLTDESIDAPARLLRQSTADQSFLILDNGQSVTLD